MSRVSICSKCDVLKDPDQFTLLPSGRLSRVCTRCLVKQRAYQARLDQAHLESEIAGLPDLSQALFDIGQAWQTSASYPPDQTFCFERVCRMSTPALTPQMLQQGVALNNLDATKVADFLKPLAKTIMNEIAIVTGYSFM